MELATQHWLRRLWSAYRPVIRSKPYEAYVRRGVKHPSEERQSSQVVRTDEFEETVPLVFPLH